MRAALAISLLTCAAAACGPRVRPAMLEDDPPPPAPPATTTGPASPGRGVLVGEMCPEGAAGRPAVAPLFARGVGWTANVEDVTARLERSARAFAVLGPDGKRAGVFEVLGAADVGLAGDVAIGSYVGRGPCTPYSDEGGAAPDAACVRATSGCGIAVASIDGGAARDAEVPELTTGAACIAGDALIVDVDGDGASESFAVAGFVDPVRAPAEEVIAAPVVGPACDARFAVYGHVVRPPSEPGVADDPRYDVGVDVLGVVDLDADGRHELVIAFRYPDRRTLALYSAQRQAGRLDLVGEAVSWLPGAAEAAPPPASPAK